MKKRLAMALAAIIIVVVAVSTFAVTENYFLSPTTSEKPFYVGVTYCGNSVAEAEQLIDKVKSYTNLFVLDSGTIMNESVALNQICGHAVDSGLNVIVFFANNVPTVNLPAFVKDAKAQWGNHFLGIYYDDEPGGKMLDGAVNLYVGDERITKQSVGGSIIVTNTSSSDSQPMSFSPSGEVTTAVDSSINETFEGVANVEIGTTLRLDYLQNGTIICGNTTFVTYPDKIYTSIARELIYEPNGAVLTDNTQQSMMTVFPNGSYTFTQKLPVDSTEATFPSLSLTNKFGIQDRCKPMLK